MARGTSEAVRIVILQQPTLHQSVVGGCLYETAMELLNCNYYSNRIVENQNPTWQCM